MKLWVLEYEQRWVECPTNEVAGIFTTLDEAQTAVPENVIWTVYKQTIEAPSEHDPSGVWVVSVFETDVFYEPGYYTGKTPGINFNKWRE